jgi:demethylmenaquinone methyltransferase/2-methoxy-6-polyprenyl-1,4-benzoquinol methylase
MTGPRDDKTTHFGFREVPESAKAGMVGQVFSSVASRYDIMNDVMSFGIHRLWKRFTIEQAGVRAGQKVLDLAGGTGDLAAQFVPQVGAAGSVTVADINAAMLDVGRARFADRGLAGNVEFVQANVERLLPGELFRLHHHRSRPQRHHNRRGARVHVVGRAGACWCSNSRSRCCRA